MPWSDNAALPGHDRQIPFADSSATRSGHGPGPFASLPSRLLGSERGGGTWPARRIGGATRGVEERSRKWDGSASGAASSVRYPFAFASPAAQSEGGGTSIRQSPAPQRWRGRGDHVGAMTLSGPARQRATRREGGPQARDEVSGWGGCGGDEDGRPGRPRGQRRLMWRVKFFLRVCLLPVRLAAGRMGASGPTWNPEEPFLNAFLPDWLRPLRAHPRHPPNGGTLPTSRGVLLTHRSRRPLAPAPRSARPRPPRSAGRRA